MGPKRKQSSLATANAEPGEDNGMTILHRSSFIDWRPSPVVSIAGSQDGSLCASLRENGDIELYDISTSRLFQRIPGHTDASPTSIAIVDESKDAPSRIFIAGLDGNIVEADIEHGRLSPAHAIDSHGGAVWQLAVQPINASLDTNNTSTKKKQADKPEEKKKSTADDDSDDDDDDDDHVIPNEQQSPRIAAACDDGAVRIFTVTPTGLEYTSTLPRTENRILSVAWYPNGNHIISAGCDGCIHVWDLATQREVLRITANDSTGREIFIWHLLVLPDGTIVSGDSAGNVCFWDGTFGTLLNKFSQHIADVLQLAASDDGSTVFATGVDPQIAVFHKLQPSTTQHSEQQHSHSNKQQQWVYLSSKRPHSHDVRALCSLTNGRLVSGGNDTILLVHSIDGFLKEHPRVLNPCPQKPIINATSSSSLYNTNTTTSNDDGDNSNDDDDNNNRSSGSLLMSAQRNVIDIWQLSTPTTTATTELSSLREGERITPTSLPVHILKIVNKTGNFITAAALSHDGDYIAYSDAYRTLCFALHSSDDDDNNNDENSDDENDNNNAVAVARLRITPVALPDDIPPAVSLHFRPTTNELISLSIDGTIHMITMPSSSTTPTEHATATIRQVHRELHDLRYKMWYKRDKARSAAHRLMPPVELIAPSFDGTWLAGVVRRRIHLIALESNRIAVSVTPHDERSIISAVGFTPDSQYLTVVSTTNEVSAFEIPSGHPSAWTERHASTLPRRLLTLPGPLYGMSPSPASLSALLIYSSGAVCHLDVAAPVHQDPVESKRQRRKAAAMAWDKKASPAGQNARALYCNDPVLYVQAIGKRDVLVVERAWRDVYATLAAPMYRHRYGT